ncbi:MAG: CatB-related O-acetyltransferase [Anaerovorax sp.]|nr:CatB-related O-acetyltransferase [Anaerovorax sp.]
MNNKFESWLNNKFLKENIKNPNIEVGDFTYYSGYYHKEDFEDICVRYLLGDRSTRSYKELFGEDFIFDKLIIGKYCSIGSGSTFLLAGNQGHRHEWISTYPFQTDIFQNARDGFKRKGNTIIGNDVWIGTEAMIMPGIKIGDGAIIAARSIVTKDVEPYTIVGGNPSKILKKRFSDKEIEQLLEIQWWNWEINKINEALPIICSNQISKLYEYYNKHN